MDLRTELFGFTLSVPIRRLFHLLSGDLIILSHLGRLDSEVLHITLRALGRAQDREQHARTSIRRVIQQLHWPFPGYPIKGI